MSTPSSSAVRLAVIPGDGIGQEVTDEALKVLAAAVDGEVKLEAERYDLGAERYLRTGEVLPDTVLAEIRQHDAILLGAVGGKPGDVPEQLDEVDLDVAGVRTPGHGRHVDAGLPALAELAARAGVTQREALQHAEDVPRAVIGLVGPVGLVDRT